MDPAIRQITRMPLDEIWDNNGVYPHRRLRYIDADEIRDLLRQSQVRFVVADCGMKPQWVPAREMWNFWKHEIKPHLAEHSVPVQLEAFPDEYCHLASEWGGDGLNPIILLGKSH